MLASSLSADPPPRPPTTRVASDECTLNLSTLCAVTGSGWVRLSGPCSPEGFHCAYRGQKKKGGVTTYNVIEVTSLISTDLVI